MKSPDVAAQARLREKVVQLLPKFGRVLYTRDTLKTLWLDLRFTESMSQAYTHGDSRYSEAMQGPLGRLLASPMESFLKRFPDVETSAKTQTSIHHGNFGHGTPMCIPESSSRRGNRHLSIRGVGQSLPPRRITHEEDPLPQSSNKLALLQTCRQIYQEAAGVLYSSNDFELPSIGQIQAFNRFTEIVSPTRLACMRTMTLICEVSYFRPFDTWASESFAYWDKLWSTMCVHMSALRHLKVRLKNLWACQGLKMTLNSYWVKPMLQLRNLDSFELLVEPGDIVAPQSYVHLQIIGEAESLSTRVQLLRRHLKQQLCSPR
ncbi:MAG: hypothetical protein Q9173_001598 [Seirophora scorigena]